MSQLKKGAVLTYIKIVLTNIVGLLLTPFIIKNLGDSEYGVYILIGSFVGYLGLMNLGINNAIIRYVAKYKAKNDKQGEQEFLGTTMWIYIVISLVLTIIGYFLYFKLDSVFADSLTTEELRIGKIMFIILVGNIAIALPGGAFSAICSGYESFVFPNLLSIIKYIVRAIVIFCALLMGGKGISIVVIDTVLTLMIIIVSAIFVRKKLGVQIPLKLFNKKLVKDIFNYSIWVFLFAIVFKFQWNTGQIILGINTDTTTVAIYGIGVMLGGYYGAFASGINSVLIPRATQMVVRKSSGIDLTEAMIKIGRLNTFILLLVISGFILFGRAFISLWVGEAYIQSWAVALLYMSVLTLPLIQSFGNSILEAKRLNRYKSIISALTVTIAIALSFLLTKVYGIFGVVIPLVLAMAINSIIMNFYYRKKFDFKIFLFFKECLLSSLIVFIILTSVFYYVISKFNLNSWFSFVFGIVVYASLYLITTYYFLMNNYEKTLILNMFKRKKK
ncbi:oligosaccharide flippase family protein [Tamlana sp. I1]|uniref:oligosaccharide flippase family protein n=1 Tax=Tamlana sp. I1 TaxID=2762061 RepID=UPI00188FD2CD|nr:oligosaccharide flippase family protein [Tamlana sp. I1]